MSKKLFVEDLKIEGEMRESLRRLYLNHHLIYSAALDYRYTKPTANLKEVIQVAEAYIAKNQLSPVIIPAIHTELYYQQRKFRKEDRPRKSLTDVQYFTLIIPSYNNTFFTVNEDRTELTFVHLPGVLKLPRPLPELPDEENLIVYFNLSYSNMFDTHRVSVWLGSKAN